MMASNDSLANFRANQLLAQIQLGRNQYPELLYQNTTETFAAPSQPIISDYINLNRPLGDFLVQWKGRVKVTVANYTAVSPDAPQNLLQNFRVYGNHRVFNQQVPWNISGASAFLLGRLSQATGGSEAIVNNTRVSDPGQPQTAGVALTTAGSPYDLELFWWFPMYPLIGQGRDAKIQGLPYYLNGDDWGNSLKVQWQWGDATAFGDPTGAAVAFSAYGSDAGTPTISLYGNYAINGDFIGRLGNPGVVTRNEVFINTLTAVTAQPANMLALQQNPTTNIIVRSGVLDTHQSAGVQTYASLSDRQLDQTSIWVDSNKPVRNNWSNMSYKAYAQGKLNTIIPQGTFLLPFDESQSILNAYRFDLLSPSTTVWLKSQVLSASAQNQQSVIQEMVYGGPFSR
jgi:hypothetical protein